MEKDKQRRGVRKTATHGNISGEPVGSRDHPHTEFWERGQRAERQISLWLCSGLFAICRTLTHKTHTYAHAQPFAAAHGICTC